MVVWPACRYRLLSALPGIRNFDLAPASWRVTHTIARMLHNVEQSRRRLLVCFSAIGLGATMLPGALWAQIHEGDQTRVTAEMLKGALAL